MTFEIGLLQPIFVYQFGPLVFKRVLHAIIELCNEYSRTPSSEIPEKIAGNHKK
jgi:hypothetical protein